MLKKNPNYTLQGSEIRDCKIKKKKFSKIFDIKFKNKNHNLIDCKGFEKLTDSGNLSK